MESKVRNIERVAFFGSLILVACVAAVIAFLSWR